MIHVGRNEPAAARTAFAAHDQVVAFDLDGDAVAGQQCHGGGKPIGFFDA